VIIALGESIVAIGAGVSDELDAGIIVAAVLGVIVSCALWWAYFDVWALIMETRFRETHGHSRILIARDVYAYLHLPMIAGVVLVALGIKKTIGDVDEPLKTAPAVALFGGIALYYAGHVGARWRLTHTLFRGRLVALAVSLALIPVGTEVDALVAMALAAVLTCAVILYEAIHYAEARHRIRAGASA
jgi:low temperature requirement protein LtrA